MKVFLLNIILITSSFSGCEERPKFYEGYICTTDKKPLTNVKICELNATNCSVTDINGFFKIKKEKDRISDLVVLYKNKSIDTINTVWSQHGDKLNYSFIEGKKDTLFVDIK
ncbi:hypothetical protein [Chryseobacterium terrae]|uniref:CarboxypepD_reg-like domain-containing protein n=1 Tax=Chryseobacterium terrae TaxID=3163299 RepID=A0ABW8Y244_9FLAO